LIEFHLVAFTSDKHGKKKMKLIMENWRLFAEKWEEWDEEEEELYELHRKDRLPGGAGDDLEVWDVHPQELEMGIEDELEHTNDREIAKEIAIDHLAKIARYYTKAKKAGL
jgi:hypothetical protein